MSKFADVNEKIADGVVGGFNKIADKFVDTFIAKEGETVAEAKARMAAEMESREAENRARVDASLEAAKNAYKQN